MYGRLSPLLLEKVENPVSSGGFQTQGDSRRLDKAGQIGAKVRAPKSATTHLASSIFSMAPVRSSAPSFPLKSGSPSRPGSNSLCSLGMEPQSRWTAPPKRITPLMRRRISAM